MKTCCRHLSTQSENEPSIEYYNPIECVNYQIMPSEHICWYNRWLLFMPSSRTERILKHLTPRLMAR